MIRIGHRGVAGYEIENTAKSIERALSLGVNMIELDVRRCYSGELVIFHDKKIDRITNGSGLIKYLSLAEIKNCSTFDGQKILTLPEALDIINGRCMVNLHIKARDVVPDVVDFIRSSVSNEQWSIRKFVVSSFNAKDLQAIKKLDERIRTGILFYRHILNMVHIVRIVRRARKLSVYSVHLHGSLLDDKLINVLRENDIKSFAWTLNRMADIKNARQLKVDGIISDFPDLI